jgi:hypothetical protein
VASYPLRPALARIRRLRFTGPMVARHLALMVGSFAALGCASTGAPAGSALPEPASALAYYPLLPGWGWAYEVEREGTTVLALYAVSERRPDLAVVKHGDQLLEYALLGDGIARREAGRPGDYILKSPVQKGDTWRVTDGSATVAETDKIVNLPSGSYRDCAVVEEVRRSPDRVTRTTYCRFVGPVLIEVLVGNPASPSFEVAARARLRSRSQPEGDAAN